MSIELLEKARKELDAARSEAHKAATTYKAAAARVASAQERLRKLEFAAIEAQVYIDRLQQREQQGR